MPRPVMFDCVSSNLGKEAIERELSAKENWIRANRNDVWQLALGPIQGRIQEICQDKDLLLRKLMDSKDEYFRYCKATPPPPQKPGSDLFVVRVGPDICDECIQDPTIPMRTPPDEVKGILFEGLAKEGGGYYRYLRTRYDSGLPETRFCTPPTTNSEYAWKLLESVRQNASERRPRLNTIGPAFYRSRGTLCHADYAPYHFPRIY
ncbi:unnamed protein product [Orchesella dallaii]|uniref:Sperm microtubule inner protein 1 C-terminal domain-containing protein n=1 Tax=Orchesella dallaii TaxID=48710 RepID=A0ABP1PNY1_9HEXA